LVVGKKKARKCLGIIAKSERAENVSEERIKVLVREELESKLHCAWWGGVGWVVAGGCGGGVQLLLIDPIALQAR
jgi:hypothetical protein